MVNKSIQSLNAKFHTGSSDERYCDCVGLILLHLRFNNYQPVDESRIPRGMTRHNKMRELLRDEFNCTEVHDPSDLDWCIALMYYDDTNGHLGVYFPDDNVVHHMAPFGKCSMRPGEMTTYWRYDGN